VFKERRVERTSGRGYTRRRKAADMRQRMWFFGVLLVIVLLISGCAAPGAGGSVSLMDAQNAFAAVIIMGADVIPLTDPLGAGFTIIDNSAELKRRNITSTLMYDVLPNDTTFPTSSTVTATGFPETYTGYSISGTIVETLAAALGAYTGTYNLSLSHPALGVNSITGVLTGATGGPSSGTLYFNGTGYTYAQLMGP
jgi:hypothetical protein